MRLSEEQKQKQVAAEQIVHRYSQIARPIMRQFMDRSSCIASVRTTVEVMRIFRLQAREYSVSFVFEVPEKKYARIAGFSHAERKRMAKESQTWKDDIPENGGWNGHLIALVENRWLIDPSIDQAHAPEFGVEIAPEMLVIDTEGHHWNARCQFDVHLGLTLDNGVIAKVKYRSVKNRGYLNSDAWNDEGLPLLADAIAEKMHEWT
jgi:hypothetical protein